MKKTSLITTCIMMFSVMVMAQSAQGDLALKTVSSEAKFSWVNSETIDMGNLEKGKPATVTFEFTNTGDAPLLISSAKAQCGCTSIEYSRQAVAPNQKGFVKATYNAANTGVFNKTVTLAVNTKEQQVELHIKGVVK